MIDRINALVHVAVGIRVGPVGDEHGGKAAGTVVLPALGHRRRRLVVARIAFVGNAVLAAKDLGPLALRAGEARRTDAACRRAAPAVATAAAAHTLAAVGAKPTGDALTLSVNARAVARALVGAAARRARRARPRRVAETVAAHAHAVARAVGAWALGAVVGEVGGSGTPCLAAVERDAHRHGARACARRRLAPELRVAAKHAAHCHVSKATAHVGRRAGRRKAVAAHQHCRATGERAVCWL